MAPKMSKASAAKVPKSFHDVLILVENIEEATRYATLSMQEAKDKEKKLKAAGVGGGEGGAGSEELLLQIQTLTNEKAKEEELRSYMQLERVGSAVLCLAALTLGQRRQQRNGRAKIILRYCSVCSFTGQLSRNVRM